MSDTIYDIPLKRIDGTPATLRDYAGDVMLVVNVASACGLTPQYESLERTFEAERERGLIILGFPSNQFGAQEPGSNEEIAQFCSTKFGVSFPMFEKIEVNGPGRHPLYRELVAAAPEAKSESEGFREKIARFAGPPANATDVLWNFEKFLIARDGHVVARFSPDVTVDSPLLSAAIAAELGAAVPS
jgi:glutathione peroxidase